jgi:hypothetical protein
MTARLSLRAHAMAALATVRVAPRRPPAPVPRPVLPPSVPPIQQGRVFVFIVRRGIEVDGASLAQALCDHVFGVGSARAVLWKVVGPEKPTVARALVLSSSLGVGWTAPVRAWEGTGPDGVHAAALFWDTR